LGESVNGFDGAACWHKDQIGLTKSLAYSDRDIVMLLSWLRSGLWLTRADPAILSIDAERSSDAETVFAITLHRVVSYLTVSGKTGLPTKLEFTGVQGDARWEFSDYQETLGWQVPMTVTMTDPLSTKTIEVSEIRPATLVDGTIFASPASSPPKIEFNSQKPPDLNMRRAASGHVLVDVAIDDNEPKTFIFDTGAGGTAIDRAYAMQLRLPQVGEQKAVTIYGVELAKVVTAESVNIGPVCHKRPKMVTMDLEFLRQLMQDNSIMGIIGYDLLSQCVCEIELGVDKIRVYDSGRFDRDLNWQPIVFYQNIPLIPAKFPQGEGMFRIDVGASSGAAGNVVFHSPLVDRLGMANPDDTKGIEGTTEYVLGKVDWFELSGHRFESPAVIFSLGKFGPLADPYIDGNIGVEFLKHFRIVLDYRNARMAFQPAR
jgi:hypothetical protein